LAVSPLIIFCSNQDHKKKTPCTSTEELSWETLLNKGRKPNQSFSILLKRKTSTTIKPNTLERLLTNLRRIAPKRGANFSQEQVFAEISKLTLVIYILNGDFTFIYITLSLSIVVSIGTTWMISITHNIINNYHINYLLR
jgi:hypothetical protein